MKTIRNLLLLLGIISGAFIANGVENKQNSKAADNSFDPAESINQLAIDLYKQTSAQEGNLFLSPYSISTALAMVYGGARGETAEQMNDTLHFGGPSATHPAFSNLRKQLNTIQEKGDIQLSIANSLWLQKGYNILPDYLSMTKEFYGAGIEPVDFNEDTEAARLLINNWVATNTNDKIKDLIAEGKLDSSTRLVLVNAIYFKGNWEIPFEKEATSKKPFTIAMGKKIDVPTMHGTAYFNLATGKGFKALEMPYAGHDLSMIILLPNAKNGLATLEKTLEADLLTGLEFNQQELMVQLPKFKFDWKHDLADMLSTMGAKLAFSDKADFSGLDGSKNLYISQVIHQAFIEMNEAGTEAAAATAVMMMFGGVGPATDPLSFTADHPFLFLIRENSTGTILFIGRVVDPST